ncbi:MAG TPA: hypothetical protein VF522_10920 [Ramlibacter sp.]|uniref:hypothetical protein n=1 Tax=Ramlibacter sp. TaxID=1917967 RepID=UPI002ED63682
MHSPEPDVGLRRVEAARYALLRRLTLAMRHRMVVHLQPIGLITQVIERRLRDTTPDMARIGQDMGKVNDFARSAVHANLDVVSWLAPDAAQVASLDASIEECIALLGSHFSFRGFQLRHEAGDHGHQVSQAAIRALLPAVLFGLSDDAQAPAEIVVRAEREAPAVQVEVVQASGPDGDGALPPYRPLGWDEIGALAVAEGAHIERSENGVRLRFRSA